MKGQGRGTAKEQKTFLFYIHSILPPPAGNFAGCGENVFFCAAKSKCVGSFTLPTYRAKQ
jgi:hypothetical protein